MKHLVCLSIAAGLAFGQQPAPVKPPKPASSRPAPAASKPAPAKTYREIKYPPLNEVKVPEPVRFELPNGMIVYLVEDRELPMIDVAARIRTGSRWEPVPKAGLAEITGAVIRTGGTSARPGDKLDEELDRLGAVVETGIGEDSGRAMISVLEEDIDQALGILSDLLQNPAFPEDKIELEKTQHRDAIARRNDDPGSIASREFERLIFGKNSPYAHQTEYATIDAIQREDLVAFHKQYFQPENVVLGAWGDFDSSEMRARIEKAFGGWSRGGKPKPEVPPVDPDARDRAGVYLINKDDVNQSTVIMGYLGGKRNDPDYYALSVMNIILGGGFASRLFSNVRSGEGLAYHVSSSWSAGWDRPGLFIARGGTKSETTLKIVNSIQREIAGMAKGDVTDEELGRAKDNILKGFAFEFDSTAEIVNRMITYEYFGYPRDYLQRYRDNIEKVTRADVARVAGKYLDTSRLAVLVLGKQKDFEQPVATLGKVVEIDITIPEPKQPALAAATPEAVEKGKGLLAAARKAMGGDAVAKVKDWVVVWKATFETPQGSVPINGESTTSVDGKMLQKMTTPMGEMAVGYDGRTAWMKMGANTREAPASEKGEIEGGIFRETFTLLQNFERLDVQALGDNEVAVSDPPRKQQVKLSLDPSTRMIVKKVFTASMMGPPAELEETYSDFRDVEGVKFPFKSVTTRSGKTVSEQTVTEVKLNPGVADSAYAKP